MPSRHCSKRVGAYHQLCRTRIGSLLRYRPFPPVSTLLPSLTPDDLDLPGLSFFSLRSSLLIIASKTVVVGAQ